VTISGQPAIIDVKKRITYACIIVQFFSLHIIVKFGT
jgi:hypothetical protein